MTIKTGGSFNIGFFSCKGTHRVKLSRSNMSNMSIGNGKKQQTKLFCWHFLSECICKVCHIMTCYYGFQTKRKKTPSYLLCQGLPPDDTVAREPPEVIDLQHGKSHTEDWPEGKDTSRATWTPILLDVRGCSHDCPQATACTEKQQSDWKREKKIRIHQNHNFIKVNMIAKRPTKQL